MIPISISPRKASAAGAGVVTAKAVKEAVDEATGILVAVSFAKNEALIDMLKAARVPLSDKQAVAGYIEENLDEIAMELRDAEVDAFQDELLEALTGIPGGISPRPVSGGAINSISRL